MLANFYEAPQTLGDVGNYGYLDWITTGLEQASGYGVKKKMRGP